MALIFAVALVLRLVNVWQLKQSPFFSTLIGDGLSYDTWARQIASGDWLGIGAMRSSRLVRPLPSLATVNDLVSVKNRSEVPSQVQAGYSMKPSWGATSTSDEPSGLKMQSVESLLEGRPLQDRAGERV